MAFLNDIRTQIEPFSVVELAGKQAILWTIEFQEIREFGFRHYNRFTTFKYALIQQATFLFECFLDGDATIVVGGQCIPGGKSNPGQWGSFFGVDAGFTASEKYDRNLSMVLVDDGAEAQIWLSVADPALPFGE